MTHSLLCLWLVAFATISTAVDTADSIPSPTSPSLSTPSPEPASTPSPSPVPEGECKLLGPFSLLVQVALGAIALLSLVYKRWKERPQRPLKVWAFDVSKQVFGSSMLHLANIFMSMFSAGQFDIAKKYNANPCSYYLLNLGIDVGAPFARIVHSFPIPPLTGYSLTDHIRDPDPNAHIAHFKLFRLVHATCRSSRIHRIRELR